MENERGRVCAQILHKKIHFVSFGQHLRILHIKHCTAKYMILGWYKIPLFTIETVRVV